ncbi:hypothetical protein C1H46_025127 [Malus baccata]|uniref:Prefoldin chaperone subunit family protein n=1 Tax=Malus baccata TaxID=106549 RepID=A0A540LS80_MALBA|nr:hypothetical protein C1H46_025127 [Malus baccata]
MEAESSPRMRLDHSKKEGSEEPHLRRFELDLSGNDHRFHSMSALEILRETVRILRYNSWGFLAIAMLLICPISAVLLSNFLVDQSLVKRLTIRMLLIAKSSGLPLRDFIRHSCQKFAEMAISCTMCFPLYITLSLLSKAAVVYSVYCSYSLKKFDASQFYFVMCKIWRRVVSTYMWMCMVVAGSVVLFLVLLLAVCNACSIVGLSPNNIVYAAMVVGLAFSVVFANAIIICNIAFVISVLEDVSGPEALVQSGVLIKGQTQVGLLIFLGSSIGMAFVEGLFEHRVKTLSYGDGSSRIWEGPLLVIMYSFVVLIDSMNSAVFYFSCRSLKMETSLDVCGHRLLNAANLCIGRPSEQAFTAGCNLKCLQLRPTVCVRRSKRALQIQSSPALMDISRQNKIQKFEEFVDQRLKPDLVRAIAQRDKVFEQQKVFSDLRKNIENLEKNSVTSLRSLVNLGSEVYMQADVPDTRHIFVDIGLGFHVEFTWSEALNYISQREEKLARQVEECTNLIASIKAQIKLVCEGIRELLQLPAEAKTASERIF